MNAAQQVQLTVGTEFQRCLVPRYTRVYPPSVHGYFGRDETGTPLGYDAYLARVASGALRARDGHGLLHAARVALYAGLLAVLHRRYGGVTTQALFELQMAAAFHDVAREDEGVDRWDAESGAEFAAWLLTHGHDDATAQRWAAVVAQKDAARASSFEQAVLHDADALDIQRFAHHRRQFDRARLHLYRTAPYVPTGVKDAFVTEIRDLIGATERDAVKCELERRPDFYVTLLRLVVLLHRETSGLSTVASLLADLLES